MAKPVSVFNLYAFGRGYVEAAKMIFMSPHYQEKQDQALLPMYLLVGFSIELLLKAFLQHKGTSDKVLKSVAMRHDLEALLTAADRDGLTNVHTQLWELVNTIKDHHRDHEFRYAPDTTYPLLDMPLTFGVLDALEERVALEIDAKAQLQHLPLSKPWPR